MLNASKLQEEKKKDGFKIPALEPSNYPARVVGIIDLGVQPQRPYKEKEKPPINEIMITYELTSEFLLDEEGNELKDKPRHLSETIPFYPLTAELATSTKRYNSLDPKGEFGGDFSKLIGCPCTVTIVNNKNKKTGKIYNNIASVTPPMKGFTIPELKNEPRLFDRSDPDMDVWEKLPDWIQEKIKGGLDYYNTKLATLLSDVPKEEKPKNVVDSLDETPF